MQAMLQSSCQTLQELHHVHGREVARMWADPGLRLTRC